ncbi:MAG: hypothetical protein EXS08_16305 [Planctomycetes bacterium]|nr:hypothetical protein [Planctomycetota bacterium]
MRAVLTCVLALGACAAPPRDLNLLPRSPIEEPYAYVQGGSFSGTAVAESPDPLVAYRWTDPKPSDALQIYLLQPKFVSADPPQAFARVASLTSASPDVTVQGIGAIRLDFGVESAAWIEFDSPDCPGEVEMSISEYNEPGVEKTRAPVQHGNTYRLELNDELYDGVRFAWIRVTGWHAPWHITGIRAVCQVKPTNYAGSFACSDPLLTRSWYMAAYGVKAALCNDYFGSILMDRGDRMSWTGDAHPAQAAALVALGNTEFVRRNLENTANQDNGIRSYALYWVLSLLDYYRYTGDADALRHYLDNACTKLDTAFADFGKDPALSFYGWDERLGAGFEIWFWPSAEPQRAYEMLAIRTWREFADAMEHIGRSDLRERYAGHARTRLAELSQKSGWYSSFGVHAAADALNTGLLDQETRDALYTKELSDRVNRLSLSPFNEYFILQALARLGKWDDALWTVRDMWGGMLEYGGTTTFEVYRPSWNRIIAANDAVPNAQCGIVSLCHPWGAGVVPWLSEQVLGIVPTAPGFTTYDIRPHLGSTLTRVCGSTPTPAGEIRASFDLDTGAAQVHAPLGTLGRLCVPKAGRAITRISINGELAFDGQFHALRGIAGASEDPEFVNFDGLEPGEYSIATVYRGRVAAAAPPPELYAARLLKQDTTTGGDWGGVYGRDGFVLCSYRPDGTDQQSLPSYVSSLDFFRAFPKAGRPDSTIWAASTADHRALASDAANSTPRTAACTSNNDQTMSVAIRVMDSGKHRIALYFVDWEKRGSRSAVELFDADTLRMLAPVSLVRGHAGGVYLVYECEGPVKFRFNKVRGELVTLSGIFFDPVPSKE